MTISRVTAGDVGELLPLMRAYCDFYEVAPSDEALLALSRALIADPEHEGVQLIARGGANAVGFATIYWSWATTTATRIGVMNDLYVAPEARGTGVADALIEACTDECRQHGAERLTWQTAKDIEPDAFVERVRVVATRRRRQEQELAAAFACLALHRLDERTTDAVPTMRFVDDERADLRRGAVAFECGRNLQMGHSDRAAVELGDDHAVAHDSQTLQAYRDRLGGRRIAELGEQAGDRFRIARPGVPDRQTHGTRLRGRVG